jgi:type III pantothenate kinase
MKRLLIDIGNSRVKWCLEGSAGPGPQHAAALAGDGALLFRRLLRSRSLSGVVAVCVAGIGPERALRKAVRAAGLPPPRMMRSSARAAGVRNGYQEPWRLGADRWVAAIGAWHLAGRRRPVCVVDVGTALTLDVVDAGGRHRGGLIVPGPDLMVRSLLTGTTGIARRASGAKHRTTTLLATDTRTAMDAGAIQAAAALVDRLHANLRRRYGRNLVLYLTGGAAPRLQVALQSVVTPVPDLVLKGLAALAASPADDHA